MSKLAVWTGKRSAGTRGKHDGVDRCAPGAIRLALAVRASSRVDGVYLRGERQPLKVVCPGEGERTEDEKSVPTEPHEIRLESGV
jgi:hypothetical protein